MSEEMNKKQGKLIVFSAPSGSGKTTIVRHLLKQEELNLEFSISATSREARGNEVHGKDYYYLSLEEFKNKIKGRHCRHEKPFKTVVPTNYGHFGSFFLGRVVRQ